MSSAKDSPALSPVKRQWNTKNLPRRLGTDFIAAGAAGATVAPIITIIDKAIIENASNRATLTTSMRRSLLFLCFQPHRFVISRPFALIFLLYTGTYSSANLLDTLTSTTAATPASSVTHGTAKFATTSVANLSLCLYKDSQFTKLFGAATSTTRPVGLATYALFAARDCLTIFASFNLPPRIAPLLPLSKRFEEKAMSRASVAQFLAPAALQVFSTPLHLLGLDLYNRPMGEVVSLRNRAAKVWHDWGKSAVARVCRIVPAFGLGGVINFKIRKSVMRKLE